MKESRVRVFWYDPATDKSINFVKFCLPISLLTFVVLALLEEFPTNLRQDLKKSQSTLGTRAKGRKPKERERKTRAC